VYVIGLIVSVLALVVFGILAMRFGYDSRETVQSNEMELARLGVKWTEPIRPAGRVRRARRFAALKLLALAEWLAPGAPAALAR
jgi:hypothetical protein